MDSVVHAFSIVTNKQIKAAVAASHDVSVAAAERPTMAPAATAAIQSNGANSARVPSFGEPQQNGGDIVLTHAVVARLRFVPAIQKFIDPPLQVLIRDGRIDCRNVRRCGLTMADLDAVLRQHGLLSADQVHLAIFEAKDDM